MRELPGGQQGDSWRDHRLGRVTASRMKDLMAYSSQKGKAHIQLKARTDYAWELMAERTTHCDQKNKPPTLAMQWGTEQEPNAIRVFEKACNTFIIPVGFVLHPRFNFAGASPDGLTEDAILEVKCPESTTYLRWRLSDDVPEEHRDQMYWQMACTGRRKGIFIGYDPRQPEGKRIFFRDLPWNEQRIAELEAEALKIDAEIEDMLQKGGFAPTQWLIEDGELVTALPSKDAPESPFRRSLKSAVLAQEIAAPPEDNLQDPAWAFLDHSLADVP